MVTGVEYWKNARNLCIYIESGHIISREYIKEAENAVRKLCFDNDEKNTVEINERYLLSKQYNTENLMEIYWDSIVSDLRDRSELNAQLIKNSEYKIDGNTISFSVNAGTLASERVIDIRRFIEDVFARRFGMTVIVNIQLVQKKEDTEDAVYSGGRKAVEVVSMNANGEAEIIDDEQWANYEEYYRQNYEEITDQQKNEQESQMIESFDAETNAVSIDVAAVAANSASEDKDPKKDAFSDRKRLENFYQFITAHTDGELAGNVPGHAGHVSGQGHPHPVPRRLRPDGEAQAVGTGPVTGDGRVRRNREPGPSGVEREHQGPSALVVLADPHPQRRAAGDHLQVIGLFDHGIPPS